MTEETKNENILFVQFWIWVTEHLLYLYIDAGLFCFSWKKKKML